MSRFLAPIHFWLFNKVKIHEELEKQIESNFKEKYGDKVSAIVDENIDRYGDRLKTDNLEEIIDQGNIHGWLQGAITVVETRQAAILSDLFKEFGEESVDLAREVFRKNALENARVAAESADVSDPENIYNTLNNFILDGMPCDSAGSITKSTQDELESRQNNCLHVAYWRNAGADIDTMYSLRSEWINAFVGGVNGNFEYKLSKEENGPSQTLVHSIKRK